MPSSATAPDRVFGLADTQETVTHLPKIQLARPRVYQSVKGHPGAGKLPVRADWCPGAKFPSQLFDRRKLYQDGSLPAVSAGQEVVPTSEFSER
ncbi:hypothetical protein ACXIVK_00380 [Paraburkholderia caledonica]